ncbi:RraA family protein [Ammoniphilus resinae]|uniref:Putative 4-hydroxy-4-methyl-2-oxoglutarate aldolase n=1 Tax=Ammoniphilus resinae TaxID=861532 RepID=A0ABS4GKQ6_9BACL|nr:RraA family protein [Ammoniphilus resinae]MBP1930845.1 RraA family protein [Ammoniphilus resinae]
MNIIDQLKEIPTTCVSDALNGQNSLDSTIKPLDEQLKVVGRAVTVKISPGDNLLVLKAMREANPGDVLVIDAKSYMDSASCGDFNLKLAQKLGLAGVVIDGVVRDVLAMKEMNYPVFARGVCTAASKKYGAGEINVPISCGATVIQPGDIIHGDADGVVVIPRGLEEDVLKKAQEKLKQDMEREERILTSRESAQQYIDRLLAANRKA